MSFICPQGVSIVKINTENVIKHAVLVFYCRNHTIKEYGKISLFSTNYFKGQTRL